MFVFYCSDMDDTLLIQVKLLAFISMHVLQVFLLFCTLTLPSIYMSCVFLFNKCAVEDEHKDLGLEAFE